MGRMTDFSPCVDPDHSSAVPQYGDGRLEYTRGCGLVFTRH